MWVPLGGAEILVGLKQRVPVGHGVGGPQTRACWDLCALSALCVAGHRGTVEIFKQGHFISIKQEKWILDN